jgi:hypothetical protein
LIPSEYVHWSPNRCSSEVVSCGMRLATSASGVSSTESTLHSAHFSIVAAMPSDFLIAIA